MFQFHPQWKEELVCTASGGTFILQLDMGKLTAHLPDEAAWKTRGPQWAVDHWATLHRELQLWCRGNNADLLVHDRAPIY